MEKLYLDFDGTMVNTIKSIVHCYNRDYMHLESFVPIDWQDVKTYSFEECYLCPDIRKYFSQQIFFDNLEFMKGFSEAFKLLHKDFIIEVITMGTQMNLELKRRFLKEHCDIPMIGIDLSYADKSHIDLSDGILIDDDVKNLSTSNAKKNYVFGTVYPWNESADKQFQRLKDWNEVVDILYRRKE